MSEKPKGLTRDEVRAYLKKKWKTGGNCTVCDANAWVVVEEEYCLPARYEAKNFPVSVVVCERCGATIFFSADIIRGES
ncbi:MAG TPA: hypothetical protein PLP17_02435 [Oligoflexia bacterium]|nr:hypothetical protein [Oligoflexia bacterium]